MTKKNLKNGILLFAILTILFSCAISPKNYQGYIYTRKGIPVSNVSVCEENKNNCTKTDKNGFFILKKEKNSINDLIVIHNNKPIDTLKTVWVQRGEKINYSFVEGRSDTLFIDMD